MSNLNDTPSLPLQLIMTFTHRTMLFTGERRLHLTWARTRTPTICRRTASTGWHQLYQWMHRVYVLSWWWLALAWFVKREPRCGELSITRIDRHTFHHTHIHVYTNRIMLYIYIYINDWFYRTGESPQCQEHELFQRETSCHTLLQPL